MLEGLKRAEAITLLRMRACFTIRAAWRRLPLELWDRIFAYYLDTIRTGFPGKDFDEINKMATFAPGTLSLVPNFWRAVTQAAPSIWKDVTIPTIEPLPGRSQLLIPMRQVEPMLSRLNRIVATPHSLSLTVSLNSKLDSDDWDSEEESEYEDEDDEENNRRKAADMRKAERRREAMEAIPLQVLLQSHAAIASVQRLHVSILSNYRRETPVDIGMLKFSSVSSLVVVGPDIFPDDADSALCFPSTKKAVLIGIIADPNIIPTYIPWAHLTHLLLGDGISLLEVYLVLSLCTSLIKGCFWMPKDLDDAPSLAVASTLPHLTELALIREREKWVNFSSHPLSNPPLISFFNLAFPKLTRVQVFGDNASFSAFSNLTHLTVVGVSQPYSLEAILDGCPLLVEVFAKVTISDPAYLSPLLFRPDRPKGVFLQVIALICHTENGPLDTVSRSLNRIHDIASSRLSNEASIGMTKPEALKRLIIRFHLRPLGPFYSPWAAIQAAEAAMTPFVAMGLQSSFEILSQQGREYWPRLDRKRDIRHWDSGMDEMLKENWEYTTSIGPSRVGSSV